MVLLLVIGSVGFRYLGFGGCLVFGLFLNFKLYYNGLYIFCCVSLWLFFWVMIDLSLRIWGKGLGFWVLYFFLWFSWGVDYYKCMLD